MFGIKVISALLLSLILGFGVTYFCPLFDRLPTPTGFYAVGTTSYHWIDSKRTDLRMDSGHRELMIHVYYPRHSSCHKTDTFSYMPEHVKALKETSSIPLFFCAFFPDGLVSYAERNAPLEVEKVPYPVILFLPGIGGSGLYSSYLEELASHGYVVVYLVPTFDTAVTVFPDGKIVSLDATLKKAMDEVDRLAIYNYRTAAHERWKQDIEFVIEKLSALSSSGTSLFYHALNMDKVGLLGHSHGGWVVTDFCAHSAICKAGINMDGWTKTVDVKSFNKPFLFLLNDQSIEGVDAFYKSLEYPVRKEIIPGAGHEAFSDFVFIKKSLSTYFGISSDPNLVRNNIIEKIVTFFDAYLK